MIEGTTRTRLIRKRLTRLEKLLGPKYTETGARLISLEESYREMWKLDKEGFIKRSISVYDTHIRERLARKFQAEVDAAAARDARRLGGSR